MVRIDLGQGGKIIGTKRVSPNGQVSGLREFAGQEILVVLPGTPGAPTPEDVVADIRKTVEDQMAVAFQQYESLRSTYGTPEQAARTFLQGVNLFPNPFLGDLVQKWAESQPVPAGKRRAAPAARSRSRSGARADPR